MRRLAGLVAAVLLGVAGLLLAGQGNAAAASHQVMIENYAYSPASITVRVGDSVTWMQHDEAPHDVVTTSAPEAFRSPLMEAGQQWSYTFTQPGTYSYYCSVHPDMRATVTVLPPETPEPPPQPQPQPQPAQPAPAPPSRPAPSTEQARPGPTSAAASPSATTTTSTSTPAAQPTQQAAAQAAQPTLDPMLLVAGVVTAVAVLCLLLVSARPGE